MHFYCALRKQRHKGRACDLPFTYTQTSELFSAPIQLVSQSLVSQYRYPLRAQCNTFYLRDDVDAERLRASNDGPSDALLSKGLKSVIHALDLGNLVHMLERDLTNNV